jgi:hypothetical protein
MALVGGVATSDGYVRDAFCSSRPIMKEASDDSVAESSQAPGTTAQVPGGATGVATSSFFSRPFFAWCRYRDASLTAGSAARAPDSSVLAGSVLAGLGIVAAEG